MLSSSLDWRTDRGYASRSLCDRWLRPACGDRCGCRKSACRAALLMSRVASQALRKGSMMLQSENAHSLGTFASIASSNTDLEGLSQRRATSKAERSGAANV